MDWKLSRGFIDMGKFSANEVLLMSKLVRQGSLLEQIDKNKLFDMLETYAELLKAVDDFVVNGLKGDDEFVNVTIAKRQWDALNKATGRNIKMRVGL